MQNGNQEPNGIQTLMGQWESMHGEPVQEQGSRNLMQPMLVSFTKEEIEVFLFQDRVFRKNLKIYPWTKMKQITIKYEDVFTEEEALGYVRDVIRLGKISEEGKSYCYDTHFRDGTEVFLSLNTKNPVYNVRKITCDIPGRSAVIIQKSE